MRVLRGAAPFPPRLGVRMQYSKGWLSYLPQGVRLSSRRPSLSGCDLPPALPGPWVDSDRRGRRGPGLFDPPAARLLPCHRPWQHLSPEGGLSVWVDGCASARARGASVWPWGAETRRMLKGIRGDTLCKQCVCARMTQLGCRMQVVGERACGHACICVCVCGYARVRARVRVLVIVTFKDEMHIVGNEGEGRRGGHRGHCPLNPPPLELYTPNTQPNP